VDKRGSEHRGGDITTGDIGGTALLHTLGGNIKTGRIGASGVRDAAWGRSAAKLETEGGHIQVLDVAGDLTAFTGGGHINVGNIAGDASLRTGGGHIRAANRRARGNWTLPVETSPSRMPEVTLAYAPAAGRSISARCAARTCTDSGAGFALCTFSGRWSWNRAAAASA